MFDGLKKYLQQEFTEPVYSEIYWEQSVAGILEKKYSTDEQIKAIFINSIFISYDGAVIGSIQVRDEKFNRNIFKTATATGIPFTIAFPFWYYVPGNQMKFSALGATVVEFAVSYQTITEHAT